MSPTILRILTTFVASGIVVFAGAAFGYYYLNLNVHSNQMETDYVRALGAWDGTHYLRIAEEGYSYRPNRESNVVFFPAYPAISRCLATLTGLRVDFSLVLVANLCFAATLWFLTQYVNLVKAQGGPIDLTPDATVLTMAFFPTSFYFRMAYSESLFALEVILVMYGARSNWRPWCIAGVVGFATATRPTGVALLAPLLWHLWEQAKTWKTFLWTSLYTLPIGCCGLVIYAVFLFVQFGDPFVFISSHRHWDQRPARSFMSGVWNDLTLEPISCVYDPDCECFTRHGHHDRHAMFSMFFANPIYMSVFLSLICYGWYAHLLNTTELLLAGSLIGMAYFGKGYTMCMLGQARYSSVVIPAYLAAGWLVQRVSSATFGSVFAVTSFFLGAYSALFVRWYNFY